MYNARLIIYTHSHDTLHRKSNPYKDTILAIHPISGEEVIFKTPVGLLTDQCVAGNDS